MDWYKLNNHFLLLIAGCVWMIAGFMVVKTGMPYYMENHNKVLLSIGAFIIFLIFYLMIFSGLVYKHDNRIKNMPIGPVPFWQFFDKKSYIIIVIMMGGGFTLRHFELVPHWFIGFFYTGLGTALFLSGVKFLFRYISFSKHDVR